MFTIGQPSEFRPGASSRNTLAHGPMRQLAHPLVHSLTLSAHSRESAAIIPHRPLYLSLYLNPIEAPTTASCNGGQRGHNTTGEMAELHPLSLVTGKASCNCGWGNCKQCPGELQLASTGAPTDTASCNRG